MALFAAELVETLLETVKFSFVPVEFFWVAELEAQLLSKPLKPKNKAKNIIFIRIVLDKFGKIDFGKITRKIGFDIARKDNFALFLSQVKFAFREQFIIKK